MSVERSATASIAVPTRAVVPGRDVAGVRAAACARWASHAACAWALAFAAISFYWAAGGTIGADTIGNEVKGLPGITALLWAVAVVKVIVGLVALALIRPWGRIVPRRLLLGVSWTAGVGMIVYGGANLTVRGLMAVGAIGTPASMHSPQAAWHLELWDPWWLLGGVLFSAAAWSYRRRMSGSPRG